MIKKNEKKYHRIAGELRKRIENRVYEKELPSIRKLAEEFNVHVITARKALLILKEDGWIDSEGNRKYRILKSIKKSENPVVGIISYSSGHVWSDLLREMVHSLQQKNLLTVIIDPSQCLESEKEDAVERLLNRLIKLDPVAIVIHNNFLDIMDPFLEKNDALRQKTIFIVNTSRPAKLHQITTTSICIDDFSGAYKATRHLISLGHQNILLLTHAVDYAKELENYGNYNIISGYFAALQEAGYQGKENILYEGNDEVIRKENLEKIFNSENRPTAIFADEDFRAIRVFDFLKEMKLNVPDDVALVGFYNTPWSTMHDIQMTSISIREKEIARLISDFVSSKIKTPSITNIEPELIIRESCGWRK